MKNLFNDAFTLVQLVYPNARFTVLTATTTDQQGQLVKVSDFSVYVGDIVVFRELFPAKFTTPTDKVEDAVCVKAMNKILAAGILSMCMVKEQIN